MFPLILPAGCWCRRPAGHPHKHATTAESGCFRRCWCSCRWLCGMAITNNINYFSCFNVSTSSLLVVGVAALQAIRTNTQQRRRVAVFCLCWCSCRWRCGMAITNNINFAVVGVRAAGFVARQSPTTLITFHVLMSPHILPAGCWCRRPAGHPHKHATTAESGCFFAVVGVRAAGAVAWQSPTTLITFHVLMFPHIFPAGCWCCHPDGHPHKHATTAESGCFRRCWCSCRWLCGMAITNNTNYYSCFNVSTHPPCWLLVLPPCRPSAQTRNNGGEWLFSPLLVFVPLALWPGNHQQH